MNRAIVAMLVAPMFLAMPAAADVLCRSKAGGVFVRVACKKRETGIALPQGAAGDPGTTPLPTRAIDAAGRQVGLLVEPAREDYGSVVVFEVGTQLVSLGVGKGGLYGDTSLYHLAADCSDARVVLQRREAFIRTAVVMGSTAYYAGDPISTQTVAAYEHPQTSGTCGGGETTLSNGNCCAPSGGQTDVGPATVAFELSTFTPPFHLEP